MKIFEDISMGIPILLYNNYVIDMSKFIHHHPGSSEVMNRNIGTNISLLMEGYMKITGVNHRHSNHASKLVRSMIIGKMEEKYDIQMPLSMKTKHPFEL